MTTRVTKPVLDTLRLHSRSRARWSCPVRLALACGLLLFLGHFYSYAAEPNITAEDLPRTAPTEPNAAISTFKYRPGIKVELVAAEPLVVDPIAMCFDEDSRLFVVEMRDYSERRDERLGRIRMLEDTNDDGVMDKSTVYADDLPWPTALIWYDGGLFVGSTPDIFYIKDADNDGKADDRKVIFTGFGSEVKRLNVQALLNSFQWGLDNRIHGANGGNGGIIITKARNGVPPLNLGSSDFSFDPRTLNIRRENGGGQYGLTFDHAGRKFVCSNSAHLRQVMYDYDAVLPDMLYPLPSPALDIPVDGANAPVYRISPEEPWRVIRTKWRVAGLVPGPIEGGGRSSGYFTSATGVTIYSGTALGADFHGDAFIADVGSNLIHRKKLRPNGVPFKAERAADESTSEFLASKDVWFRPVAFANAPDGALYFADMYREVIEHPWSIPENMKRLIDLNAGNDRGRVYRVVSTNFTQPRLPKLSRATTAELVDLLAHPNGWHRHTASRLLHERHFRSDPPRSREKADTLPKTPTIEKLRAMLRHKSATAQLHALNAMVGMDIGYFGERLIGSEDLRIALDSPNPDVREGAIAVLPFYPDSEKDLDLAKLANDRAPRVRYQFAWTLAALNLTNKPALLRSMLANATDPWERHAIHAAISRDPSLRAEFPQAFSRKTETQPAKSNVAALPATSATRAEAVITYARALDLKGNASKGQAIYTERCAICHRYSGQGTVVGPDLESVRSAGKETILANILDPNREVQPRFATTEVMTTDDEQIVGVLANDAPNGITLRQANGIESFLPRAKIKSSRTTSISLMPEGLEAGLTPQDLSDLLTYISGE